LLRRRVVKRVLAKNNVASQWSLRQERRFLYDEWNMIAESSRGTEARWTDGTAGCPGGVWARAERPNQLDVPSNGQARLNRSYAWGLDASGTLTGAGGVGGLLLTSHHTPQAGGGTQVTTLAPLYDFNGNVLAYADVATSTITHRMEYDPFGQELSLDTLLAGEGAAEAPRFRFSTKYTDGETGLVYYGFRFYSPELGRWVNRDPIEEMGGINLYGFTSNQPIDEIDVLGLSESAALQALQRAWQDYQTAMAAAQAALQRYYAAVSAGEKGACNAAYQRALDAGARATQALRRAQAAYRAAAAASAAAGTLTGGSLLTGAGSLSATGIGALGVGAAVVGAGIGYGISQIPTGNGENVASSCGCALYDFAPDFWDWLIIE
jgi:RHS repeat-associated protein